MAKSIGRLVVAAESIGKTVEEVYIAVSDLGDGEGIYTLIGPSNERIPLVAINKKGLDILRQFSRETAEASGKTVSIICFTSRSHYETLHPRTTGDDKT